MGDIREMRAIAVNASTSGFLDFCAHAMHRRLSAEDLLDAVDAFNAGDREGARPVLMQAHKLRIQRVAWLMLQLSENTHHLDRAIGLLMWVTEHHGSKALTTRSREVLVEALVLRGRIAEARAHLNHGALSANLEWRARADVSNPFLAGAVCEQTSAATAHWLDVLNEPWRTAGLATVLVSDTGSDPYLALTAEAAPTPQGELVSVVVSSYRPGPELEHAVQSVLASSWTNLEVVVVDDASGPDFADTYARVAALDDRVRVHHCETNGGTYAARNWALAHAQGRYVTFHDSDDWMHPQRLEVQMTYLAENPDVPACLTRSLRVTRSMGLLNHRSLGAKVCEPSLLFEREPVAQVFGGFDPVRKGADAEFRQRLEAAHGRSLPVLEKAPLTLQLIDDTSLSGGEIRRYWVALHRRLYRSAYERWHTTFATSGSPVRVAPEPSATRRFYAPPRIRGEVEFEAPKHVVTLDLLKVRRSRELRAVVESIRRLTDTGGSVGLVHCDEGWTRGGRHVAIPQELVRLFDVGNVELLEASESSNHPSRPRRLKATT